jgi:hypothetical protein
MRQEPGEYSSQHGGVLQQFHKVNLASRLGLKTRKPVHQTQSLPGVFNEKSLQINRLRTSWLRSFPRSCHRIGRISVRSSLRSRALLEEAQRDVWDSLKVPFVGTSQGNGPYKCTQFHIASRRPTGYAYTLLAAWPMRGEQQRAGSRGRGMYWTIAHAMEKPNAQVRLPQGKGAGENNCTGPSFDARDTACYCGGAPRASLKEIHNMLEGTFMYLPGVEACC